MTSTPQRPIRILSFDGGGVRGLSSLILLRGLMERLSVKTGTPAASIRPSDYFDLIIGTGTGGISAIFVGRMRMTVDEAINAYMRVARTAFDFESTVSRRRISLSSWNKTPRLDGKRLQSAIEDIVKSVLKDPDAKLEDPSVDPAPCRTAVLAAIQRYASAPPHVFRSYSSRQPASQFTLTEVACATISTSSAFEPFLLGNPPVKFVDAGLSGYNNPVEVGLEEAAVFWPDRRVQYVVSLGTGRQQIVAIGERWESIAEACMSILDSCEQAHNRVFRVQNDAQYFRFNVDHGLEKTNVKEWKDIGQHGDITSITEGYMNWAEVDHRLNACATMLSSKQLTHNVVGNVQQQSKNFWPSHHPAPKIFHGREEYVASAVNMLLYEEGVSLAILGTGGIGKTAIACTILHNSKVKSKYGDHRHFIPCEGISSTFMLVDTLCDAFAFQPHSSDHQSDLIIFLEDAHRVTSLLIILDNFETVWEVEAFKAEALLECLANIRGISLLLTMRGTERPARIHWTKPWLDIVEPFSATAAYNTFIEICEKGDKSLPMLLQELDHIPLVVTLMAHLAQVEKPSVLLERWRKEKTKMLSSKQHQSPHNNVDTSISLSLESHRMKGCPEALILLSILALLPGGVPRAELALIIPSLQNHNEAVATLLKTGLAYYDHEQHEILYILSPIRLYILENNPPSSEALHDLEGFYFEAAHDCVNKLGKEGANTLNKSPLLLATNMEAILSKTLLETKCNNDSKFHTKIQAALDWTFFLQWNSPQDTIIQMAIKMAQQHDEHSELYAQCLQSLGDIQRMLNNNDQAQDTLSLAKSKFEAIGNQLGAAQCLRSLVDIQRMLDNNDQAQEMLYTARAKFEVIGDQLGTAQCLQSLGDIQRMLDNNDQAQEMLSLAMAKFEAIGDHLGAAQCLRSLGDIQKMLNNYIQAQEMFSTARENFKAIENQLGVAQCLQSLGNIQQMLDNNDQAQEMLSLALAKFEAIGNQLGAAQCLQSLGNIQRMLDNNDQAQKMLSSARATFEAIGNLLGAAQCLQSLGYIQGILNNNDKAQKMLSTARGKFEVIGDQLGAAQCLRSLGDIQRILDNYNQAQEMLSSARAKFEAIGNQLGTAQCLQSLGYIQRRLNNNNQAQEMLSLAMAKFEAIGDHLGEAQCLRSLGDIQQTLGNHDQAQEMLYTARAKFEAIGDQLGIAQCLRSLGDIQRRLENNDQSQKMLSLAKAKFEAIGHWLGEAQCLQSLGNIHQRLENYDQAQEMLSSANAKFEAIGHQLGTAQCLRSLGYIQKILENYNEAQDMLSKARAKFEAIGNQRGVAQCLQNLGDIQQILGNNHQAQEMLFIAKAKFEAIGNQLGAAQCLQILGNI